AQSPVHCFAPCQVERLVPKADAYQLRFEDRGPLSAQLVVLADGADSKLRTRLGIGVEKQDYGQVAIIANVATDQPHGGVAFKRFTETGPVALLPMGES